LPERFEDPLFAGELCLWGEVLPGEEPAHVDGWRDGFDLFSEGRDGASVDALEDAALAPLDVVVFGCCSVLECSAHEEALHLNGEEGLKDSSRFEAQGACERVGGGGSEDL